MATCLSARKLAGDGRTFTRFEAVYDAPPTARELAETQHQKLGYHPAGYGGPNRVRTTTTESGNTRVIWECSGCCD